MELLLTLILMGPCLVGGEILSVGQRDVNGVERSQEVLGAEERGEDVDDGGLRPDTPGKVLVRCTVSLDQALLVDDGQAFLLDGRQVVAVVTQVERLEPLVDLVDVLVASLNGEDALDDGVAVSVEVVSEVAVVGIWVEAVQDGRAADGRSGLVDL